MGIYTSDDSVSADVQLMRKLFSKYGKKLYLRILEKTDDRAIAKELTKQAFADVYSRLSSSNISDSFELLLNEFADTRMKRLEYSEEDIPAILDDLENALARDYDGADEGSSSDVPRRASRSVYAKPAQRGEPCPEQSSALMVIEDNEEETSPCKKRNAGLIILTVVICAVVGWCVAGSLMSMSWLPELDLGYEWFENNIYKLF